LKTPPISHSRENGNPEASNKILDSCFRRNDEESYPEGAPSFGRSPGRGVGSYTLKSDNISLTFKKIPKDSSPPLAGGDESRTIVKCGVRGRGGKWFFCPPPPSPSPIKGEGRGLGNSK